MESKLFDNCPNCGSKETIGDTITKETIAKGHATEMWRYAPITIPASVLLEKVKESTVPIGGSVDTMYAIIDICSNCGTVYATKVQMGSVKKSVSLPPPNLRLPQFKTKEN